MNNTPTTDTGPGFLAFVAFFLLALALWFLMRNMNARMRRMSYRQQAAHRGRNDPPAAEGGRPRAGARGRGAPGGGGGGGAGGAADARRRERRADAGCGRDRGGTVGTRP